MCAIIIRYRNNNQKIDFKAMCIPMIVLLIGVIVSISGFILILMKLFSGYKCSHGQEPFYCKSDVYANYTVVDNYRNTSNDMNNSQIFYLIRRNV